MTRFIGRRVAVGIGKETTRGLGVATSFWIPMSVFTFFDRNEVVRPGASFGRIYGEGTESEHTTAWAEGNIEMPLRSEHIGLLLLATLGSIVSTAPDDPAKKHDFSVAQSNQHQSLTIHVNEPNDNRVFELAMIEELKIDAMVGDVVRAAITFMSKRSIDNKSPEIPSYSSENTFSQQHVTVKFASALAGLTAATPTRINSLSLSIRKNIQRYDGLGTIQPIDLNNRQIQISGEIELPYNDRTFIDLQQGSTKRAMRIAIVNSGVTIGGSSNPGLQIDLNRAAIEAWEPRFDIDEIATQRFTFTALYDLSNDEIFDVFRLINETGSY